LTRSGDHDPVPDLSPMPALGPVLARLSTEIYRPLESLRCAIDLLIVDPSRPITDAERIQARTMLGLCDDLSRLTRECLESQEPSANA
jgi:hypothetical protein